MLERTGEWMVQDCAEFTFDIDEYDDDGKQMIFTHLRFHSWNASSWRKFRRTWAVFRQALDCPLYALGNGNTFAHFVSRLGFVPVPNRIVCANGETKTLFVSHKDPLGNVFNLL